jgi:putative cell wall-binding protein
LDQDNDGDYDALIVHLIAVPAGVTISETGSSTDITEGGATDTYSIALDSRPTFDVTVGITPNGEQTTNLASVTFTANNWDVPQLVTTTAVDNGIPECPHTGSITHAATSVDLNYDAIGVASVTPNIADQPCSAPAVAITESDGSTNINEAGPTSDTYTLALTSPPTANVTVTISPNAQQMTDQSSATFTPLNWHVPQTVTVTAVDDPTRECAHVGSIAHASVSADLSYNGLTVAGVAPNITDNELCDVVNRITSTDAKALSIEISKARFRDGEAKSVLIARDDVWIDAFVGTPLSTIAEGPMLLNPSGILAPEIKLEIDRVLGGSSAGGRVYLLGQEQALSAQVRADVVGAGYDDITRLGGRNRGETARLVAQEELRFNPGPTTKIFISENTGLVDAIAISAEAGNIKADDEVNPILLQVRGSSKLDVATEQFLSDNPQVSEAIFIGGTTAITPALELAFTQRHPTILTSRLFGSDRYGTVRAIVDTYFPAPGGVVVAGGVGSSLVAALLAGGLAADNGEPLLITRPLDLPVSITSYLQLHAPTLAKGTIVGNEADVSPAVADTILQLIQ